MLDLIEGVAKLELLATEQADRFELLSTRVDLLAQDFSRMGVALSQLAQDFSRMGGELTQVSTQVVALAVGARESQDQLKRVARLMVGLAGDHQRIEGLEERVEKLERKAG